MSSKLGARTPRKEFRSHRYKHHMLSWLCQNSSESSCFCKLGSVRAPGSQAASGTLRSWCYQAPGILGSCKNSWEWSFLWVLWDWLWCLHLRPAQGTSLDRLKELCHRSRRVPECLGPAGPTDSWCWERCCLRLTSDPMFLGMLEHLGVEVSLDVVGLAKKN